MTFLAALRCRDALVLGSDGLETRGRVGRPTIKIYSPRQGFLLAWAGAQNTHQEFALRLERCDDLRPDGDRAEIGARLRALRSEVPSDDAAEFIVAWYSVPDCKPVAAHIHIAGAVEWVTTWQFAGAPAASEAGNVLASSMRYLQPSALDVEEGKVVTLKLVSDVIATGIRTVGPPAQLGVVTAGGPEVVGDNDLRAVFDAVNLWEAQSAELLTGGSVPSASETPDTGVVPPAP